MNENSLILIDLTLFYQAEFKSEYYLGGRSNTIPPMKPI